MYTHKTLKLWPYSIDRIMENVIRHIFTSVVMVPNFINFRPKIGFESVLVTFNFTQRAFENSFKAVTTFTTLSKIFLRKLFNLK